MWFLIPHKCNHLALNILNAPEGTRKTPKQAIMNTSASHHTQKSQTAGGNYFECRECKQSITAAISLAYAKTVNVKLAAHWMPTTRYHLEHLKRDNFMTLMLRKLT